MVFTDLFAGVGEIVLTIVCEQKQHREWGIPYLHLLDEAPHRRKLWWFLRPPGLGLPIEGLWDTGQYPWVYSDPGWRYKVYNVESDANKHKQRIKYYRKKLADDQPIMVDPGSGSIDYADHEKHNLSQHNEKRLGGTEKRR